MNRHAIKTHLREITIRTYYILFSLLLCFVCCFTKKDPILYIILKPLSRARSNSLEKQNEVHPISRELMPEALSREDTQNFDFIYTNVTEAFYATLQGCVVVSILFTLPLVLYHSWCFLMPSCYTRERYAYNKYVCIVSTYLCLCFFLIIFKCIPYLGYLLHQFGTSTGRLHIVSQARISKYLSWVFYTVFTCLLACCTPLIMYHALDRRWVKLQTLWKNRRPALVLMILLAALISPPDIVSQFVCTLCLFVFYECVLWIYIYQSKKMPQ